MRRLTVAKGLLLLAILHFHLHIHFHHFHGSPIDYGTLAAGAFASWIGVPGPGEPLLIAAAVLAAKHKLDITETLLIASAAAFAGGVGGWVIGRRAGRAVLERPGPLLKTRLRALERGEEVFERWPGAAVIFTPSWIAGIHLGRVKVFLLWNAVGALIWALGIGLGAYFAGPPVIDVVDDVGVFIAIGFAAVVGAGVALELGRRRRRDRRDEDHAAGL
jgi:membrane-associated protein